MLLHVVGRRFLVLLSFACVFGLWAIGSSSAQSKSKGNQGSVPDLGPNVLVFSPSARPADMQSKIDAVYAAQQHSEFGTQRNAILFLPGDYHLDVPVGFYTQVVGLG